MHFLAAVFFLLVVSSVSDVPSFCVFGPFFFVFYLPFEVYSPILWLGILARPRATHMKSTSYQPIRVRTLEILWHGCERDEEAVQLGLQSVAIEGIVSIDYNTQQDRIVTCGGDGYIRLWQLNPEATDSWLANSQSDMTACVSFVTGMRTSWMPLTARWSPHGSMIASAHCDGKICLWWQEKREDGKKEEEWKDYRHLSGHVIDVYDLCFSPDSRYLLSAGGDGSVVIHDLEGSTVPVVQLTEVHHKFCRGVAWDPWCKYVASFGGGPPLLFFTHTAKTTGASRRVHLTGQRKAPGDYIGESCATTFRRFGWSPDGSLVAVPYGKASHHSNSQNQHHQNKNNNKDASETRRGDDMIHCVYVYTRNALDKVAARLTIRGYSEVRGVLWAPCFLQPLDEEDGDGDSDGGNGSGVEKSGRIEGEREGARGGEETATNRAERRRCALAARGSWGPDSYRMAMAVWTADSVVVYTTDSDVRHSDYTDLHMRSISDVAWSPNARYLLTASLDGYVSVISTGGSLGIAHKLPLFSTEPVTVGLCRMMSEIHSLGEKLETGGRSAANSANAAKTSSGGGALLHAPVKKKRKLAEEPQKRQQESVQTSGAIPLSELSELMENI
ncbi:chromatin assembly factor 1 subunit B, putative [Trypanosoma cruzi]|uniref:Chromatin assembly factor 1 subunit B, putative n=1 Tax=Trypanosoma cruzi (strain CL Brener) TaxID=353153 RepID=Q4D4D5_TRYCC|nr:chromatin assembly factor 1 subunit B, putative [Trypanosoma cruzi]EAN87395.1 chromatin assembly factor 1 subunit B, putative [Trypanosoma cruzi]|eukprot:XP_809246.1 chromatin assembly factor 1 subunit B [Trypanosoma cruzi strain CL Brener]